MNDSKQIYTAVPLLSEEERSEAIQASNEKDETPMESHKYKTLPFIGGSIIGAAFSIIGFRLLIETQGHDSYKNIFLFALLWSTVTSTVAYIFFGLLWTALLQAYQNTKVYKILADYDFLADIEYYFALGVFIGFCFACTISDIVYGLPWVGVTLTIVVAGLWTLVMTWFASRGREEDRNGTSLPSVVV
eukprot:CAMPEP_0172450436 /NCGR_PEP_ID=MMETSP1065-20121228/8772_1 /TAXON_ID=265537 /ORGANISM="Amphiprora paludosa, Strain CCMP125" /LENGTH=188 /DNA_ID=CAMNT_0013202217 /DNA_START=20 /DNA_END=586 /DNA_ORIENTATION=+